MIPKRFIKNLKIYLIFNSYFAIIQLNQLGITMITKPNRQLILIAVLCDGRGPPEG